MATDPRWGRIEETYGSDPYLVGRLGTENAKGIQSQRVAATAKHYAVYSIPFAGEPIVISKKFLTDFLRVRFGFKGYTVSDSAAFEDIMDKYNITDDIDEAAAMAVDAGMNVRNYRF